MRKVKMADKKGHKRNLHSPLCSLRAGHKATFTYYTDIESTEILDDRRVSCQPLLLLLLW